MKRFVKHLLPLGALLVVSTMPVQASAAELTSANLNEVLKSNTNYTSQCNTYFNQAICKLNGQHDPGSCGDIMECTKPTISGCWDKPELPDTETPEWSDVPNVEYPEQPGVPDVERPETPDNGGGNQQGSQIGGYEQQVADLVNKERAAAGLPALTVNGKLSQVAELKAEDMRDKNYFSHTSPTYGSPFDMIKQFGVTYKSAAENIAKGQKSPQSVMNGWMNSQGHRENILNSNYTEIGVGYVTDNNGNTYWVQMFIRP